MKKKNNVIFLDIDGVLNSEKYWSEVKDRTNLSEMEKEIDPYNVACLKQVVKATGARIVVSSSWKNISRKFREFILYMAKNGIIISGVTPTLTDVNRGEEIRAWLSEHIDDVDKFIILDDDVFDDFNELTANLVKTDFYNGRGLDEEKVKAAIKMLGNGRKKDAEYDI